MPANTAPIYVKNVRTEAVAWTNADAAATRKTLLTAGAEGTRIHGITFTNDDGTNRDIALFFTDGSNNHRPIGTVPAIGATTGGSLLTAAGLPWLSSDNSFLLGPGWSLTATNATQVAATKTVTVIVHAGDY